MTKRCGARTKSGSPCRRPAGWGTPNPGAGKCKLHGGCSPSGRKAASREAALTFARGALGASLPGSPLDAMQEAVDLARGLLAYYRHELAAAATADPPDHEKIGLLRGPYEDAIRLEKDVAKASIDAGVAERRQRLAELQAELFTGLILKAVGEVFGELFDSPRQAMLADVLGRDFAALEGTVLEESDSPLALSPAA